MAGLRNKLYLVGEGHGEVKAALNLVTRLWAELGLSPERIWKELRGLALSTEAGSTRPVCSCAAKLDCAGALILRDEDDGCPATRGPQAAGWLAQAALPFPAAVVLAKCEYEAWFPPCLPQMAESRLSTRWPRASWAARRGPL